MDARPIPPVLSKGKWVVGDGFGIREASEAPSDKGIEVEISPPFLFRWLKVIDTGTSKLLKKSSNVS
jgi:hypothetical protein